jgi:hypothetical protein
MRGKLVTNPSIASETPQPPQTPPGGENRRRIGVLVRGLRVGQHLDVPTSVRSRRGRRELLDADHLEKRLVHDSSDPIQTHWAC